VIYDPHLLDGVELERRPGGYARTLLFGDETMSVWAIVWSPGSATCIHDHHCSCCFAVLSGTVTETWFPCRRWRRVEPHQEAVRRSATSRPCCRRVPMSIR
jgi:predicted metal-dependent enzyme (double-stranded beta helix superfamily)